MTLENQVYTLAMSLNDPAFNVFSPAQLIWALNTGQDMFIKAVRPGCIPQIYEVEENLTVDESGRVIIHGSTSDLTYGIFAFPRGLLGIRLVDGKFCTRKSFEQIRNDITANYNVVYSEFDPICSLRGVYAYIQPFTASTTTVDVHYQRVPAQIAELIPAEGEGEDTPAVDCEFTDSEILNAINDFARYAIYDLKPETKTLADFCLNQANVRAEKINTGFAETETIQYGNEETYQDDLSEFPITPSYDFPEV